MQTTVLDFTAVEESGRTYHFEGQMLPTGEVVIPNASSPDEWYESLDSVEAHGTDVIEHSEETGQTQEWSDTDIARSIAAMARECGEDAIPETLRAYLNGNVGSTEDF